MTNQAVVQETEQLELADMPPVPRMERKRTERQQFVLDAVTAAGPDGILAEEVGAIICERRGRHSRDERCRWDGANGKGVLEELKAKELVRYRRRKGNNPGVWIAIDSANPAPNIHADIHDPFPDDHADDRPVPYNALPAGF